MAVPLRTDATLHHITVGKPIKPMGASRQDKQLRHTSACVNHRLPFKSPIGAVPARNFPLEPKSRPGWPGHETTNMFTLSNPPTQAAYVAAITAIRDTLGDREREVLRLQFQQPGRAVTSQEIRDHFGYSSIGASNLLYGTLGKTLATQLPMETETPDSNRNYYWRALSTGDGSGEHFLWIMRPELANALVETGFVQPGNDGVAIAPDVDIHVAGFSALEGRPKLVLHLVRERNRALVAAKKASVTSPKCEVCEFSFVETYGENYCEVHHLTPLADLTEDTETTLDDLAIVCANCHRVIHLQSPPETIQALRERIAN